MDIQQLVATANLRAALSLLPNNNESLMLTSRYNKLQRDLNLGLVTTQEAFIEQNKIVQAILNFADNTSTNNTPQYAASHTVVLGDINEAALISIVVNNKRRRSAIAEEAQKILNDYRSYKDNKAQTPTFDPANRRLKTIQEAAISLIQRLEAEKEDSLVNAIERIAVLLESPVPTYDELTEAYNLACGRGFKKSYIEQQLQNQPDDEEIRIIIAEEIEAFAATISVA